MILTARQEHCFTSHHLLTLDGKPAGSYNGRWFSEGLDVSLLGQRSLRFQNRAFFGSDFCLQDDKTNVILAEGVPSGWFSSPWNLELSLGPCRLQYEGWFTLSMAVVREGTTIARVDRLGWCEAGWQASGGQVTTLEDLLLVGLIFQILCSRRQRSNNAAAMH